MADLQKTAELYSSALFLRREFLGRDHYDQFPGSSARKKTIYVFDTDIIVTGCEPWLKGPEYDQRAPSGAPKKSLSGLGSILPAPDDGPSPERTARETVIADILATHVLLKVRWKAFPIYQMPGHFQETSEIYRNAQHFHDQEMRWKHLSKNLKEAHNKRVLTALIANKAQSGDPRSRYETFALVRALLNRIEGSDGYPQNESDQRIKAWDRFLELNTNTGGIYPVSMASKHLNSTYPKIAEQLEVFSEMTRGDGDPSVLPSEENDLLKLLNKHFLQSLKLLKRTGSSQKLDNDASALAHLFLVNARLRDSSEPGEEPWRVVFITGDRAITEVGYEKIPNLPEKYEPMGNTFSKDYVRHLWAYVSEALVEPNGERRRESEGAISKSRLDLEKEHFINWLDGLLVEWSGNLNFEPESLTYERTKIKRATGSPDKLANIFSNVSGNTLNALEKWQELTEDAITNHRFGTLEKYRSKNPELIARILNRITSAMGEKTTLSWSKVVALVEELYDRHKDEKFLEFSNIGVEAVLRAGATGKRNPPDLSFDSLEKADSVFSKLSTPDAYSARNLKEFECDYNRISEDCYDFSEDGDNRQLCHLQYLVLGAAFASADHWGVALSQGKRALKIVERSIRRGIMPIPVKPGDEDKTNMSGREAYFLCAAAYRMIATKPSQFREARQHLNNAEDALHKDLEHYGKNRTTVLRFRCEWVALSLSEYYLNRSIETEKYFNEIVEDIYVKVGALLSELQRMSARFHVGTNFKAKGIGKVTLVHLSTNLIQAAVIAKFRELEKIEELVPPSVDREHLECALHLMGQLTGENDEHPKWLVAESKLMKFYKDAGARILNCPEKFPFVQGEENVKRFYSKEKRKSAEITAYDPWRYERLGALAKRIDSRMNG